MRTDVFRPAECQDTGDNNATSAAGENRDAMVHPPTAGGSQSCRDQYNTYNLPSL